MLPATFPRFCTHVPHASRHVMHIARGRNANRCSNADTAPELTDATRFVAFC